MEASCCADAGARHGDGLNDVEDRHCCLDDGRIESEAPATHGGPHACLLPEGLLLERLVPLEHTGVLARVYLLIPAHSDRAGFQNLLFIEVLKFLIASQSVVSYVDTCKYVH